MFLLKKLELIRKGTWNIELDDSFTFTINFKLFDETFSKKKLILRQQVPGGIKTEIKPKHLLQLKVEIPTDVNEQRELVRQLKEQNVKVSSNDIEFSHQILILQQLRQAFLTEAVQGKLVPQNSNDELASELFKKIIAAKQKLVLVKKLRKERELPPVRGEEITFTIPDSWVWCRLGEIVTQIFDGPFGSHLKTKDYTNTGVQVIRLENLGEMAFKGEKETFISNAKYAGLKQHTVFENDIIIGSFLADGVKCVVLPKLNNIAIAKADCFTIRISHSFVSNKFLMYLLSSGPMFSQLSKLLRGMTRLRINTSQLKNLAIPLPPISEQNRIVQKLEQLMSHCNELRESIRTSQQYNEQLSQQMLKETLGKEEEAVARKAK